MGGIKKMIKIWDDFNDCFTMVYSDGNVTERLCHLVNDPDKGWIAEFWSVPYGFQLSSEELITIAKELEELNKQLREN